MVLLVTICQARNGMVFRSVDHGTPLSLLLGKDTLRDVFIISEETYMKVISMCCGKGCTVAYDYRSSFKKSISKQNN